MSNGEEWFPLAVVLVWMEKNLVCFISLDMYAFFSFSFFFI